MIDYVWFHPEPEYCFFQPGRRYGHFRGITGEASWFFLAVFAFGGSQVRDPARIYGVYADIFQSTPFGHIAGALIFVLLFFGHHLNHLCAGATSAYFTTTAGTTRKLPPWVAI